MAPDHNDSNDFFCNPLPLESAPDRKTLPELPSGPRIGQDESGKGDYFGPLVVAAAYIDDTQQKEMERLGIKDSKLLSDEQNQKLAAILNKYLKHHIFVLMPEDYNQVYFRTGTLNRLLAVCHAQVLENFLTIQPSPLAIIDQFNANKEMLENKLLERGRKIQIIQTIHGERDLAVAAASILARATFLQKLQELRDQYKVNFPKGSTRIVFPAIEQFTRLYGQNQLTKVAKVHFQLVHPKKNYQFFS